jgi:hypothetical protein
MKKIISITILFLLLLGYSCSEDFLTKEPLGIPSSAILYTTEDGAQKLLNATYAACRTWDQLGFGWFVTMEVGADDTEPGSNPSDGSVPRMQMVSDFTYLTSQTDLLEFWSGTYTLIARANMVINNAPDIEFEDEALKSRIIAEAKFLRARAYFNLVKSWGGVPIMTEVPASPEEAEIPTPRSTAEEVYDLIMEDLTEAIAILPLKSEYPASEMGRATKGAAQTLLAQVYLHQLDYSSCLTECLNVINSEEYSLFPYYGDNWDYFDHSKRNGVESIFEIQEIARTERDVTNHWIYWAGIRAFSGYGFFSPTEDLADSYEPGDPRRDVTIFFEGESYPGIDTKPVFPENCDPRANQKSMYPMPWVGAISWNNAPVNKIEMRYADVLLMAAECYNETGDPANALYYLELVRARAREGQDILPEITETEKVALRHIIWNERRWELALEGYRFTDVRRYDKVEPGFADALYDAAGKPNYTVGKHELHPIPQVEMDYAAGVLTQNPGW